MQCEVVGNTPPNYHIVCLGLMSVWLASAMFLERQSTPNPDPNENVISDFGEPAFGLASQAFTQNLTLPGSHPRVLISQP